MMMNLFSIFDPATSSSLSMNWMSIIIWCSVIPSFFWINSSIFLIFWKILFKKIFQEISNNMKMKNFKNIYVLVIFFILIFLSNCFGLLPYIFTPSSHLVFSMMFAFPFWMTLIIFSLINKFNKFMSHLVPLGCPLILSFFMVVIETVSNLIRPITLSVRLTANMISGHLLIHLLSSIMMMNVGLFLMNFIVMMMLLMLEIAVAIIQSYVFVILISLYISEV
uniref:ATP synthase F0 subunit 6 n=1 Tax=Amblyomma boeroi TaxID=575970 RepID=UPI002E783EBB|nr:ATP synthase F0 subunit 6 [Amblyomma boeroi]WQF68982.1 ATP synthase F0 subunit 6 [Amblyomma boeroi]